MRVQDLPGRDSESRIRCYRQLARIDEDVEITEENIKEMPLKWTATYCSIPFDEMRDILLGRK